MRCEDKQRSGERPNATNLLGSAGDVRLHRGANPARLRPAFGPGPPPRVSPACVFVRRVQMCVDDVLLLSSHQALAVALPVQLSLFPSLSRIHVTKHLKYPAPCLALRASSPEPRPPVAPLYRSGA